MAFLAALFGGGAAGAGGAGAGAGLTGATAAGTAAPAAAGGLSLLSSTPYGAAGGLAAPAGGVAALSPSLSLAGPATPATSFSLTGPATATSTGATVGPAATSPSFLESLQATMKQFGQGMGQGFFGEPNDPGTAYALGKHLSPLNSSSNTKTREGPMMASAGDQQIAQQRQRQQMIMQHLARLYGIGG